MRLSLLILALFSVFHLACWAHPAFQTLESDDEDSDLVLAILQANAASAADSAPLLLFRTAINYPANMQGGGGGVNEADAICQAEAMDAAFPGTFKALLGTQTTAAIPRFACINANCDPSDPDDHTNWVLGANRTYLRAEDMALIGTTTSQRIFSFPLTNPFTSLPPSKWHWGGIHSTWQTLGPAPGVGGSQNDANGWTEQSNGWIAYSHSTDTQALYTGTIAGYNNSNMHLICVQQ